MLLFSSLRNGGIGSLTRLGSTTPDWWLDMALIRLQEAMDLGLVPPSAANSFPAVGRSSIFGSPLSLTTRRRGITPARFGLYPLFEGFGLSPPPSAIGASGAVPVGRSASRRPITPDEQAMILQQLQQSGALPSPAARSPQGFPGVAAQVQTAISQGQAEGLSAQQTLGLVRKALGISQDVMNDQSLLRQIVDPILGIRAPQVGLATPEAEAAYQAQRAGERGTIVPAFAAENAARLEQGALPLTETFQDPRFPGVPFPTTGPMVDIPTQPLGALAAGTAPSALGPAEADALTAAIYGGESAAAAPGALSGLGGLSGLLSGLGVVSNLGMGAYNLSQGNLGSGLGSIGGTLGGLGLGLALAPETFGLSLLLAGLGGGAGGFLGGLLGGGPELTHAQRESREAGRALQGASGYQQEILNAPTAQDLYNTLRSFQTGYVGGTRTPAVDIGFPGRDYLGLYGNGTIRPDPWSADEFFQAVRDRPEELRATIQQGVNPSLLGAGNQGLEKAIAAKVKQLDFIRQQIEPNLPAFRQAAESETLTPYQAFQALGQVGGQSVSLSDPAVMEALKKAGAPPPAPSSADQSPEMLPGLESMESGGVVPRTGSYTLHQGEVVIPASHEQSETIQDETGKWINIYGRNTPQAGQRLPGTEAYDSRQEAEAAARKRSEEYRPPSNPSSAPPGRRMYLPLEGGALLEAKKNPDPAKFWRLAFSPQEARQAMAQRDPGEMPVVLAPQALQFGPRRLAAAAEAARRIEHANPSSTFGEFLDQLDREQGGVSIVPPPGPIPGSGEELKMDRAYRMQQGIPSVQEDQMPLSQEEMDRNPPRQTIVPMFPSRMNRMAPMPNAQPFEYGHGAQL